MVKCNTPKYFNQIDWIYENHTQFRMVALLLYSLRYAKISITSKANILLKHGFIEYSLRIIFRNNALKRNAAVYADVERTKYVSTYPCRESSSKCVTQMRKTPIF